MKRLAKKVALFNFFGVIGLFRKDDVKKMQDLAFFFRKNNLSLQIIEHMWLKIITLKLCPSIVLISKKFFFCKYKLPNLAIYICVCVCVQPTLAKYISTISNFDLWM
jgi:hypothetical protein